MMEGEKSAVRRIVSEDCDLTSLYHSTLKLFTLNTIVPATRHSNLAILLQYC